jgi:hypothetical protein
MTVPTARADQVTASLDAQLSHALGLSVAAYTRREEGFAMVAPISAEPYATTAFSTGSARARGMSLVLEHAGERVSGELSYVLSSVSQRAGAASYVPGFAATHAIALGVGVRVWPTTSVRLAAAASSGAPASVFADQIEWTPYTPSSGRGDLSGSPGRIVGALNGARLPAYLRVDLGALREWAMRLFGGPAHIAGSVTITNVFGRANALGLSAPAVGSLVQPLLLPARSVELGLEWRR